MRALPLAAAVILFAASTRAQSDATGLLNSGLALAQADKLDEAAAVFTQGEALFPSDHRFPLESAGVAYREHNLARAKRLLLRAAKLDPSDQYGDEFLGTLYRFDENLSAALKYWNRAGKPFLAQVVFEPNPRLDPLLRERAFAFSAGQVLTAERLRLTESNLRRLTVFSDTRFDLIARPDNRYDLLVYTVPIGETLSGWLGRLLPVARDLPYRGIDLDFYNIHRRAVDLTSLWRWDPDKRRVSFTLSAPLRDNPKIEYRYLLDARDELWDLTSSYLGGFNGLRLRRLAAQGEFEVGLTSKVQWTAGGTLAYRGFGPRRPDSSPLFRDGFSATVDNRFDYALWEWPERRVTADAWAFLDAGRIVSASASRLLVMRSGMTANWFPNAKGDTYRLVEQAQAGRILGNAPLDELFSLGMEGDTESGLWLRGLEAARNGRKGTASLGTEYAISQTTLERRVFHLPLISLAAGPFFDAGWTGDPSPHFVQRGTTCDTGLQAKLRTAGGVEFTAVYGHGLPSGGGVFYTAVTLGKNRD